MSNAVIEVVLGLVFVFFLFSMLCSGINEYIANILGKRADFLAAGVWSLLDNGTDAARRKALYKDFWDHPLITQLGQVAPGPVGTAAGVKRPWRWLCRIMRKFFTMKYLKVALPPEADPRQFEPNRLRPSYIPSHTFAIVLRDIVPDGSAPAGSPLATSLRALGAEGGTDRQALNAGVARWYDSQMERVSGWYKRESKRILVVLAVPVVMVLNIDTVSIARDLWTNPTLRTAVADAAERQIEAASTSTVAPAGDQAAGSPALAPLNPCPTSETGAAEGTGTSTTSSNVAPTPAQTVERALECAQSLSLPIGWTSDNFPSDWGDLPLKLVGWALTIGALTFGAPFWFDLLNRLGSLRSSGAKPKSSADPD